MPTDITVTELKETVTVTGGTTSITVTGDTATVSVATTSQPVSVVEENATFTINTIANKSDVGLGNVDDTSDVNKPVSTATQSALDAKLNKSGGTMTGALTLSADPAANLQAATKQYVDNQVTAVPFITSTDDVPEGSVNLYFTTSAFDTRLATKSTTNLAEGSNLYHTTARARASISGTGSITYNNTTGVISYTGGANPVTTDELPEGTTNKYYTDTRVNSAFDTRLATKSTSDLNEGTNLYYTSARANTDFDTRLATKATTNLAEGTNLYYTSARANSDFDTRLATKSTTNLAEGTNLYHTTARARAAVSGSTGITYTEGTGAIAVDSTIATKTYADGAAASAAAALVDASPATLDTLNELAAALGDDPNFATTVSTALGNKLNTADFGTTFAGQLAGKSTTDLGEGTNLYYTDTRARAAISATGSLSYNSTTGVVSYTTPTTDGITEGSTNLYYTNTRARGAVSGGTGVTYDSGTGVIAIGQSVATTADVVFNTVNANITDDNYVLGQLVATRNTAYVPPASALTTTAGQNGIVIASSSGGLGYGASMAIRYHSGDTTAGVQNSASVSMSGASGTSTSPGGNATNQVLGSQNFDGYTAGTSNNYASQIATTNQGAGTTGMQPLQAQGYARQAFTNSTTVTTAVTGASGTGTTATLNFTLQNTAPYIVGQTVTIAGMTPSGYNGTVVLTGVTTNSVSYANATTGFTSGGTIAAANTVTAAGAGFRVRGFANSTNMVVQNRFNFMDLTASAANFKSNTYTFANEVITGSTLTATNYMTLGSTGITMGNVDGVTNIIRASGVNTGTRPVVALRNTQTATVAPANGDGSTFRQQVAGSNGTVYSLTEIGGVYNSGGDTAITFNIANGDQTGATMTVVQPFETKLSGTTIKATASPSGTAGANTLSTVAQFLPTSAVLSASGTTYANINNGSATFTNTGINNFIRTGAVAAQTPIVILRYSRTDQTGPQDNDGVDFRLGVGGTSTTVNFARFDGAYKSSGDNEIGMSVSADGFVTDTDRIYVGSRASTKIRATPSGGGTANDILTVESTKITMAAPVAYPSYTTTQRDALSPAAGWVLFNTTTAKLECYDGTAWNALF